MKTLLLKARRVKDGKVRRIFPRDRLEGDLRLQLICSDAVFKKSSKIIQYLQCSVKFPEEFLWVFPPLGAEGLSCDGLRGSWLLVESSVLLPACNGTVTVCP